MGIPQFCLWLENTAIAAAIRRSTWLFPTIETIHVLAIVLVVGSIGMFDLRLLNIASRDRRIHEVFEEVAPWTWASFACAVIAGFLLFSSNATKYYHNIPFRLKMAFLLLAGLNVAIFHFGAYRSMADWSASGRVPFAAKFAGALSLIVWIGVVACGRWIGFTISTLP
jgi:hypothetical protein